MKSILLLLSLLTVFSADAKYQIFSDPVAVGDVLKPEDGSAFAVQSTTLASLPCPKMTEVERDALVVSPTGGCIYNLTSLTTEFWDGSQWKEAASQAVLSLWTIGANYGVGAFVYTAGDFKLYIANTAHIAGATFPGDIANWDEASDDIDTIASSTDNAIVRFDGVTGGLVQDSSVLIDDTDNLSGVADLTVTGNTTLDTGLTGFAKVTAGLVTAQTGIDLAADVTGILPVANGGSNSSTALTNDKVIYSQGGAIVESSVTLDSSGNMLVDGSLEIDGLVSQTGLGESTYFGASSGIADDLSLNRNTGFGFESLKKTTTGSSNTAFGDQSLENNITGINNTAVGARALQQSTAAAANNTAVGYLTLRLNTSVQNTAVGSEALENSTTLARNTALGYKAGTRALGNDNVFVGTSSGSDESGGAMNRNVYVGSMTGTLSRANDDNILIGYGLELPTTTTSDYMSIGDLLYGDFANSRVGVNVVAPTAALDVLGDTLLTGAATVTGTTTLNTGLTGVAKLTSGVVSASAIDLTADVTGILPVANGGTGSATQNYVDLTTAQSVAGVKTLSAIPIFSAGFDSNDISTIDASSASDALTITQAGSGEALTIAGGTLNINEDILMTGTGQLDLPSGTTAQRSGSPNDGMIRHNSDLNRFEGYKSGAWDELGGGGQGGINYIENYNLEIDATGYNTYADAAGENPVDGTAGAATITVAQNTTTPLRDLADLKLVKDAANRQGEGFSYDFTIALADQAQKLTASFEYDASHANYADGDIRLSIYDVTNSQLIRVNGEDLSGGKGKHYFQFQTAPDSVNYRLIYHVSSVNALAYDLYFDTIAVGPTTLARGAIVLGKEDFTPTGTWVSGNETYTGNYYRVGEVAHFNVLIELTGAPTSTTLDINLPSGMVIDSSGLVDAVTLQTLIPKSQTTILDNGTKKYTHSQVEYVSNTRVRPSYDDGSGGRTNLTATGPFTFASGDKIWMSFSVPIQGWSSNAKMSEDLGGRDVILEGAGNGNQALAAGVDNIPFISTKDTTASWNGTQFTAPESGQYVIEGSTFSGATNGYVFAYVNAASTKALSSPDIGTTVTHFSGSIPLNKGDVLSFRMNLAITLVNTPTLHWLSVSKLASPQTILETETVAARYTSDSGQSYVNATTIVYEDISFDTHNAYNSSTGVYTVPVTGPYDIKAAIQTNTVSGSLGQYAGLTLLINGAAASVQLSRTNVDSTTSRRHTAAGSTILEFEKGDTLEIEAFENIPSINLQSSGVVNHFSIHKIK